MLVPPARVSVAPERGLHRTCSYKKLQKEWNLLVNDPFRQRCRAVRIPPIAPPSVRRGHHCSDEECNRSQGIRSNVPRNQEDAIPEPALGRLFFDQSTSKLA